MRVFISIDISRDKTSKCNLEGDEGEETKWHLTIRFALLIESMQRDTAASIATPYERWKLCVQDNRNCVTEHLT